MTSAAPPLFTTRQLQGLCRVGDILLPANGAFPAFSATGCIDRINALMATAHPDDVRDLGLLLLVCNYLPRWVIHMMLQLTNKTEQMPALIAPPFRMLNIGLKGVIFSLYYSGYHRDTWQGRQVHEVIDYQVHCAPDQPR